MPSDDIPLKVESSDELPAEKSRTGYVVRAEGPRGGENTQVKTSYGMPELIHCPCRRSKSAGPPGSERSRESVRTTIQRDYNGITVIDHPMGNQ